MLSSSTASGMLNPRTGPRASNPITAPPAFARLLSDHAAERAVREPERAAEPARARRGTGVQRSVRTAGRHVRLVEALEDVVRHVRRVQVVALVERARFEQLLSLAADVADLDRHVLPELALNPEVVLLDIRRLQVAGDGTELERLGDVAAEWQSCARIDRVRRSVRACRDRRAVADLVCAVRAGRPHDPVRQVAVEGELGVLLRVRADDRNRAAGRVTSTSRRNG